MDLSACVTDDDYERWRAVRIAVLPHERCDTVEELRTGDRSRLMLLARMDGVVVGSGMASRADTADAGFVAPRVLPEHRRRGVGSALLHRLAEHVESLGLASAQAGVDDEGSLSFARRFGFTEVDREVEQVRLVEAPPPLPPAPDGLEVVTAAERPGLWEACFERFGREVLADFATHAPLEITPAQWSTTWRGDPMFLALDDGEVVGCAGLVLDTDQPRRAENALTAVRRDWRGRGVAVHLKQRTLEWAAGHGVREVYTWTQQGNDAMRALNERLGYATTRTSIKVARSLPLP